MALIDLIIPLYNRADMVDGLIENLEKQTFKNFRVIFVDDGSTDGSYSVLLDRLTTSTLHHLVLQQENQGPSAARNFGIDHADAQWVAFMDSDDALLPEYLDYLYKVTVDTKIQMAYCQLRMVPMGKCDESISAGILSAEYILAEAAMERHYSTWISPCCLLLDRQFLNENQLRFDVHCKYCEDLMFITKCIAAAQQICELSNILYIYFTHGGSLLRSFDTAKYLNGIEGFNRLEVDLENDERPAAGIFHKIGYARFYLAILRRAALQMSWKTFYMFVKETDTKIWYRQIKSLPGKQKLAGYLYRVSVRVFYRSVRMVFKD